ncbi:polysaccharide deacetylase family protein [Cumulibacter manganitolerans]|uniref:polysaccharide deacetylase family protein n=1 Tax=Cumulibacter manganitolerans TaxID=1884992 RepID=UPI00129690E9|nr:polysaccharide deacetylase family protein [Cumulibacter manganitolerans]
MSSPEPHDLSRRGALALLTAGVAGLVAACSRAAQRATPASSSRAPTAAGSSAAPTSASPSKPQNPPPFGAAGTSPAVEVARGSGARPEIALTFHGAGDPALAKQILTTLQAAGARATVMVIGSWLQANPSLADAIVAGGHELGNHTWTHPALAALPASQMEQEIVSCRDLIAQLTGSYGPFFRQSQGQHATPAILAAAGQAGYPTVLSYDVDSMDWQDPGAAAIRANLQSAKAGSVVSMHFGHSGTAEALPGILQDLAARGLRAVTASQLLSP